MYIQSRTMLNISILDFYLMIKPRRLIDIAFIMVYLLSLIILKLYDLFRDKSTDIDTSL